MACEHIRPIFLSEFAESELLYKPKPVYSLVSCQLSLLYVLLREVSALKLIQQTDVSQIAFLRARDDISCSLIIRVIFSSIKPDSMGSF